MGGAGKEGSKGGVGRKSNDMKEPYGGNKLITSSKQKKTPQGLIFIQLIQYVLIC